MTRVFLAKRERSSVRLQISTKRDGLLTHSNEWHASYRLQRNLVLKAQAFCLTPSVLLVLEILLKHFSDELVSF